MRLRATIAVGLVALALPAQAAAHGRGATIALDDRLVLDRATEALPGLHVRVLDGDRDFQVRVDPGVRLLVLGELGEPFLRIDARGVWANASSPTATSDRVVSPDRHGWVRLGGGRSVTWHDHRLAPPPGGAIGPDGRFSVPIYLNGRRAAIAGTFIGVARPAIWPWLVVAVVLVAGISLGARRRSLRRGLTLALAWFSGAAVLVAVTTFEIRDVPTGGVGWSQIAVDLVVAGVLAVLLARLRGRAQVLAAGVVGAVAAAVSVSLLPVFWHGVVISALPATPARLACGIAFLVGLAAAALSFLPLAGTPGRASADDRLDAHV